MTSDDVMDWDGAYRGEGVFGGPPPWNIGEPQPELAELVRAGKILSDVLDAGCGYGRNLVYLLRQGYEVFGVDADPRAQ